MLRRMSPRTLWAASVLRSLGTISYISLLGFVLTAQGRIARFILTATPSDRCSPRRPRCCCNRRPRSDA